MLAGSPSEYSRSAALLDEVTARLRGRGLEIERLAVRDLPGQALLTGDFDHLGIVAASGQVQRAQAVVIATPVYKAAYSGVLKAFLDLLPQTALQDKVVLPIATGGSPNHMLALDYALRPVLQSLAARHILPGVYATDSQVTLIPEGSRHVAADIAQRLDDGVNALVQEVQRLQPRAAFPSVQFSELRYSV
nr:NADPH-dependent FMN reductase [Ramlibacter agri]